MNLSEKIALKIAQGAMQLAARARELSPGTVEKVVEGVGSAVNSVVDEVKNVARQPRSVGTWIEAKSPWLNRQFLSAASNLIEPFLVGMGLKVERLGEEIVEVSMPGFWRNQGEGGVIHTGALVSLGEFAMRLYWEYHLDVRRNEMQSKRVQMRLLVRPQGDMKAVFRLPVSEREEILHRLRAEGSATIETQTMIYDTKGRLIAEVEVDWELRKQLSLSAGVNSANDPHEL
jgi:acyl-coenzyme A thioesterase PaaI-like protein